MSLFVTGWVVIGKRRSLLVHAPGFLEPFRSGEKVIAALLLPSRYLGVAKVPREEEGMGYIFLPPMAASTVDLGTLQVNGRQWPAIRIRPHGPELPGPVYLAFTSAAEREQAWRTLSGR